LQFRGEVQKDRGDEFDLFVGGSLGRFGAAGDDFDESRRQKQVFCDLAGRPAA
jgi:hypothetical protein